MSRTICLTVIGLASFITAMIAGYRCWRAYERINRMAREQEQRQRKYAGLFAVWPFLAGIMSGIVIICLCSKLIADGDKLYDPGQAVRTALSIMAAGFVIVCGQFVITTIALARCYPWNNKEKLLATETRLRKWSWIVNLLFQLLAAVIVVWANVQFRILGIGDHVIELGSWSSVITVLWLVAAANVVRLLDGIEGAANVLLLVAGVAIFYVTLGAGEHFLNALSIAVIGAALASLRFNFFPARLPLVGTGTVFVGFIFAILTVLARQKTVAALLLIFPMMLLVVLVGGAMLGFLERAMSADGDDK
ncbi:MAG: MraY family glycosyltransferase [bacterium]|nr:MraY family glycosyltransferase [Candidatus Sumerlaeota bacterium]